MEVALKRLLMSQWTGDIQVDKVTFLKAVMSFAGEFAFYLFIFFMTACHVSFFVLPIYSSLFVWSSMFPIGIPVSL